MLDEIAVDMITAPIADKNPRITFFFLAYIRKLTMVQRLAMKAILGCLRTTLKRLWRLKPI